MDTTSYPTTSARNRACQNCKHQFTIEPEDFEFYKTIEVPPPTFCPQCRLQRRLAWINTFVLYKRPCDLCGKSAVSVFAPDAPYTVYCPKCWWSDNWDQYQFALQYDPDRSFFEQFNELLHKTPLLGLSIDTPTAEDSPFNSNVGNLKNCYLLYQANYNEDCAYGYYLEHNKSLLDSSMCIQSENLYDCMHAWRCNNCIGCVSYLTETIDSEFLKNCSNCQNCFMSANLKHKKYYFKNKALTREEYLKERSKYDLGSCISYKQAKAEAERIWQRQIPKAEFCDNTVDCLGTHIYNSKNVKDSFQVNSGEDCRYISMVSDGKNTNLYDVTSWGTSLALSYECSTCGTQSSLLKFCEECGLSDIDLEYCKIVTSSSHCFGCVGLKKAEYCILNKRYSKEEYEKLLQKIKEDMLKNPYKDKTGRVYKYGEFFPVELSPHAYTATLAQDFYPLSKVQIEQSGYMWIQEPKNEYKITLRAAELPDHIKDAHDSILNEVIECENCKRGFKLIPLELSFLKRKNVPLPRECPFCRIKQKFRLWLKNMAQNLRTCSRCNTEFISKYKTEEVPKVLCSKCYRLEII